MTEGEKLWEELRGTQSRLDCVAFEFEFDPGHENKFEKFEIRNGFFPLLFSKMKKKLKMKKKKYHYLSQHRVADRYE